MIKVGLILNSTKCDKYLYSTAKKLAGCKHIDLYFLINKKDIRKDSMGHKIWFILKKKGFLRLIRSIVFNIIIALEYKVISQVYKDTKALKKKKDIEGFNKNNNTYIKPIFSDSGLIVEYGREDIKKIESLNLDIMIRGNSSGIFKGEILRVAKEGIISFHHGDNRWNRGGPPAFWEVYLRKPSTGFTIQILSEELDGGTVLLRGNFKTYPSYTENLSMLYKESNPYLAKIIIDYANTGKLPAAKMKLPFGDPLFKVPSVSNSIIYFFKTVIFFLKKITNRLILKRYPRWGVAYISGPWNSAILRKGVKIKNLPGRFFADPFVVTKNKKTICYVEDYSYKIKKGRITAIEIINNKNYKILGTAIEEPFHMSFPFLFEYKHDLYMVPETSESSSIRLYKCINFPLEWEYQKDILSDCVASDSMIFRYDEKWWLLTNKATKGNTDRSSGLVAFYSTNPLSDNWTAHEANPLVLDSRCGRNGGLLNSENKFPVRVRQKQSFNSYGSSITLACITKLSPSSFEEKEISQILPKFFPKIQGCHHMHSNSNYTVFDYVRTENLK